MEEQSWTTIVRGESKTKLDIKEIIKCKDLILLWVRREFVAKYKQTILGPAWAIIQPFFTTVVYSIFFGNIAGLGAAGVPNFIFYLSGNIVWALFSGSLNSNANTFVSNKGIFSKVYFPTGMSRAHSRGAPSKSADTWGRCHRSNIGCQHVDRW